MLSDHVTAFLAHSFHLPSELWLEAHFIQVNNEQRVFPSRSLRPDSREGGCVCVAAWIYFLNFMHSCHGNNCLYNATLALILLHFSLIPGTTAEPDSFKTTASQMQIDNKLRRYYRGFRAAESAEIHQKHSETAAETFNSLLHWHSIQLPKKSIKFKITQNTISQKNCNTSFNKLKDAMRDRLGLVC